MFNHFLGGLFQLLILVQEERDPLTINIARSVWTSSGLTSSMAGASCSGVGWSSLPSWSWIGCGLSTSKKLSSSIHSLLDLDFLPISVLFEEDFLLALHFFQEASWFPCRTSRERPPCSDLSALVNSEDRWAFIVRSLLRSCPVGLGMRCLGWGLCIID